MTHERLVADAALLSLDVTPGEASVLVRYAELLAAWNRKVRLVGPDDPTTILREQVADALGFVAPVRALSEVTTWLDIGAGGGLPGIVLAALCPDRHWILVEPIAKKTAFLAHAAATLGLANVTIHTGRIEPDGVRPTLPRTAPRPTGALARATFPPRAWLDLAEPAVGDDGVVLVAVAHADEVPVEVQDDPTTRVWRYMIPATGAPRIIFARRVPRTEAGNSS